MPRALIGLVALGALAGCGPAVAATVIDEPVEPPSLPPAGPARPVVRLLPPEEPGAGGDEDEFEPDGAAGSQPLGPDAPEASRIGLLTPRLCFAALDQARLPYRGAEETDDVRDPIRLTGPVGGVTFHGRSRNPEASVYEVLDCRLAVALGGLAEILRPHGIVEVVHLSMHRPDHHGRPVETGGSLGHRGGLAIDVAVLRRADGSELTVAGDFGGLRGGPRCGPRAAPARTENARVLRDIVCRLMERRLFHVILTPAFDRAHHDHVHLEVRSDGVSWLYHH